MNLEDKCVADVSRVIAETARGLIKELAIYEKQYNSISQAEPIRENIMQLSDMAIRALDRMEKVVERKIH